MSKISGRKTRILKAALSHGFDAAGVTAVQLPPEISKRLSSYLSLKRHGDMGWMENRQNQRASPQSLWPEARSVIMLGANYGPDADPLDLLEKKSAGAVSVYARNRDYHDVLKKKLKQFARWLVAEEGGDVKLFIDTAPVMEKPLAALAGLGWQGKHTNLVSRAFGSWLFLGAVFTTLELEPDTQEEDHCGSCQNCLDICPTDAFPAPYQLDARRCISYLTIEHKGPIPVEFRKAMGNRIYGCDDCLAVCPWNKFASLAQHTQFHARENLREPGLNTLAVLDDKSFREMFSGSPIKRTGRDRFVRNVLIAIGNSQDPALLPIATKLLQDESALVRGAGVWAVKQLAESDEFLRLRKKYAPAEVDGSVREEWRGADALPGA